jgi:uncharacterized protein YacL
MRLSIEFIFRIVGAVTGTFMLGWLGVQLASFMQDQAGLYIAVMGLVGFLIGLILTPYITTRPVRYIRQNLITMPPERLLAILVGIFAGLIGAALLSLPLSLLPTPFREILPIATAVVLCYLCVVILTTRQNDLRALFSELRSATMADSRSAGKNNALAGSILLDTSAIIDGRITDISKTGFIRSTLLVPSFVLIELQHIADSPDVLRRNRGRRGLDVLNILQNESPTPVHITDMDVSDMRDVDSKLVALARNLHCPIMTNDYNLNRVAELQGVTVLNINDLANAVKAAYLPGEELSVKIIQEGREIGQGVGHLDDGTMVVVEDGRDYMHDTVTVTVTKVLQTTAGRMIFARPQHKQPERNRG